MTLYLLSHFTHFKFAIASAWGKGWLIKHIFHEAILLMITLALSELHAGLCLILHHFLFIILHNIHDYHFHAYYAPSRFYVTALVFSLLGILDYQKFHIIYADMATASKQKLSWCLSWRRSHRAFIIESPLLDGWFWLDGSIDSFDDDSSEWHHFSLLQIRFDDIWWYQRRAIMLATPSPRCIKFGSRRRLKSPILKLRCFKALDILPGARHRKKSATGPSLVSLPCLTLFANA